MAEIREIRVVSYTEACTDDHLSLETWRIGQSGPGSKVAFLRLRYAESQHAWNAGDRVQLLQRVSVRHTLVLVAETEGERDVASDLGLAAEIRVELGVVPVVHASAGIALGLDIGTQVEQVALERGVVVVASLSLYKQFGGDVPAGVRPELERVAPAEERQVVHDLVGVKDSLLGRAKVRADLDVEILLDRDVRKGVQPRKLEIARRQIVERASVSEPGLVEPIGRESAEIRERRQVSAAYALARERRQIRDRARGSTATDALRM